MDKRGLVVRRRPHHLLELVGAMIQDISGNWTPEDAHDLYNIGNWGKGYVSVNDSGNITIHPRKDPHEAIDLKLLVDQIRQRGIELPILLRFTDILKNCVQEMRDAFRGAIEEFEYQGDYLGIYPIKTNQQRQVVEEFLDAGRPLGFGLECGSKPELLAVLALTHQSETPIICNGFKDDGYLEMVVFSQKMGKNVIPVVEKFSELEQIVEFARRLDVCPRFGIRVKLATKGSGRWRFTAGDRSKFGLTVTELLRCLELLRNHEMLDSFCLLHFHLGSQITDIHPIKNAITEASRIYAELRQQCRALRYFDVGGGLGVDYDGSQTNSESSMNYTLEEYARDVIFRVQTVCEECGVEHPTIITEAGRATVAYHSILVFNVLGVSSSHDEQRAPVRLPDGLPQPLYDLQEICEDIHEKNLIESYHDAVQAYEELLNSFKLGFLKLDQRSLAERLYYRACHEILKIVRTLEFVPEEVQGLEDQLAETYFCNFSIFQSLPDSWAVDQLFPILPIHRLNERPSRRGILADLTCDSDGKIDHFIDLRDVNRTLELHDFNGDNYYLAVFLVGAYQEILGDLHNLFGDTNSVHVSIDETGEACVDEVVKGDTVQQVLSYVQYSSRDLLAQVRMDVESAFRRGDISLEEGAEFVRFYESNLASYTYLAPRGTRRHDPRPRDASTESLGRLALDN
ncbi:MAG: biosynthetic arginine decarboxylase [Planctomycetota bacterium]|nr:biosynthetic arginine decarboxylase [Planctomycetota bacterium]